MNEPIVSLERMAQDMPRVSDGTYAQNMSNALMHAMTCGIGGHGHAAPQHPKFIPGPPIRPIGLAFAMAFSGMHD